VHRLNLLRDKQQYNHAMPAAFPPPAWLDQPVDVDRLARDLNKQLRFAVDTESNSLHAYQEQVCLIQFSTAKKDYLLDPLDLVDLSSLAPLFADTNREKVFHAVEYDLIGLRRDFSFDIVNIFDTMQSARILGYKQVGLDALLALKFDLQVDKRYQKADWAYRPLPPEMLNYARLDTHFLLPLRDLMEEELKAAQRWELAQEEFIRLSKLNGHGRSEMPPWQRVSGAHNFDPHQLAILKELSEWRDRTARKLAKPVFKILDDRRLVALVLAKPANLHQLEEVLTDNQRRRFSSEVLAAVKRGCTASPVSRPRPVRARQSFIHRANALGQLRKDLGKKMHLESDIVLPKSWMQDIAEKDPRSLEELSILMPDSPWRLANLGEQILKAIH
jgi:ribonuclease D